MWVCVVVCFVAQDDSARFKFANNQWVGIEYQHSLKVRHFTGKQTTTIDRHNKPNAVFAAYSLVVFAKARSKVHYPSSVFRRYEVARNYPKCVRLIGEVRKHRCVGAANQRRSEHSVQHLGAFQFFFIRTKSRLGQDKNGSVMAHSHITHVWRHCKSQVARQRPRRGCPCKQ